jgi:hypothetical protein
MASACNAGGNVRADRASGSYSIHQLKQRCTPSSVIPLSCTYIRSIRLLGQSSGIGAEKLKHPLAGLRWQWIPYAVSGIPLEREKLNGPCPGPRTPTCSYLGITDWSCAVVTVKWPKDSCVRSNGDLRLRPDDSQVPTTRALKRIARSSSVEPISSGRRNGNSPMSTCCRLWEQT